MGLREFNFERERSVPNETRLQKYWRWTREAADLTWHTGLVIIEDLSMYIVRKFTTKGKSNGTSTD